MSAVPAVRADADEVVFDQPSVEPEALSNVLRAFIQMPQALYTDQRLSDGDKMVYLALRRYARGQQRCWPGQDSVAAEIGKSTRQIQRHLCALRRFGYVTWDRKKFGGQNVYVLTNVAALPYTTDLSPMEEKGPHTRQICRVIGDKSVVSLATDLSCVREVDSEEVDAEEEERDRACGAGVSASESQDSPEGTPDPSCPEGESRPVGHGTEGAGGQRSLVGIPAARPAAARRAPGARRRRAAGADPAPNWLGALSDDHFAKCGGRWQSHGKVGKDFKPLYDQVGFETLRAAWRAYLAATPADFVSHRRFLEVPKPWLDKAKAGRAGDEAVPATEGAPQTLAQLLAKHGLGRSA